eukprot:jgi/Chlat1/8642/Chrsp87S00661
MVKAYLRYEAGEAWGVLASPSAPLTYDPTGKLLVTGGLENALVWNVKLATVIRTLTPLTAGASSATGAPVAEVTAMTHAPAGTQVAIGYSDGTVRVWDTVKGSCDVVLTGHKKAVTALRYNASGAILASGGSDTRVVLWDVAGEQGLARLQGHKDQITDLAFLHSDEDRSNSTRLISSSKDSQLKRHAALQVWDLNTYHCIQTVVGHRGEVWSLDVDPAERRVLTGSVDPDLRAFSIDRDSEGEANVDENNLLQPFGEIRRQNTTDRVSAVRYSRDGSYVGCQAAGKTLELYRVRSKDEILRKAKRRKRRKREKGKKGGEGDEVDKEEDDEPGVSAADELELLTVIRTKTKVRSFSFCPSPSRKGAVLEVALALHNNSLEVWAVRSGAKEAEKVQTLDQQGHRTDVRAVVLSSDDSLLVSLSHSAVKVWNPQTTACLRSMDSGYGLCGTFVPGDKHVVVGTREGSLEVYDVGAGEQLAKLPAHSGAVWGIAPLPDGSGLISGSADKDVKFWEYELLHDEATRVKRLGLRHVRTLTMSEDVLSVRVSPDGKLMAVALLDATIKVFFTDSLKFFLSLYGHKLPVLCMDISSDGQLLATGSADKNVKIWGLDFGDCHKSLFAHNDSVMQARVMLPLYVTLQVDGMLLINYRVKFVRNTHYMFTVGKDKMVKYWDADKFELLLTLPGHHAEVWALAISYNGDFIVTGSHDRSIRRWDRTEEPFFVEEEREKRLETLFEEGIEDDRGVAARVEGGEVVIAGQRTRGTVTAADSIIEALELVTAERKRQEDYIKDSVNRRLAPLPPNPLLLGLSPSQYVLKVVAGVRSSDLEQALLVLPFTVALELLKYLAQWASAGDSVELVCRVSSLLLRLHHAQLSTTPAARQALSDLHASLRPAVAKLKDTLGFNLAAINHMQRLLAARSLTMFGDAADRVKAIRQKAAKSKGPPVVDALAKVKAKKKRKQAAAAAEEAL